jgi:hypothetical protein
MKEITDIVEIHDHIVSTNMRERRRKNSQFASQVVDKDIKFVDLKIQSQIHIRHFNSI